MDAEYPILAHSDFGADDSCGRLFPVIPDDQAEITCNKYGAVVRSVPATELKKTFDETELSIDVATAGCKANGVVAPIAGNVLHNLPSLGSAFVQHPPGH